MAGLDNAILWTAGGLDAVHVAYRGSLGHMAGMANLNGSSTPNTGSGMRRLKGAQTAPFPIPQANGKPILGDDTTIDTFYFGAGELLRGILELGINDGTFKVAAEGTTKKTVGIYDFYAGGDTVANPGAFMFLLTRQAHGKDSGNLDQPGFENEMVLNTTVKPLEDESWAHQKEGKFRHDVAFNNSSVTPWVETCTAAFGVAYRRKIFWPSTYRSMFHVWIADGIAAETTAFDYTPVDAASTKAWNATAGTLLTVSSVNTGTKKATLSAIPAASAVIVLLYQTLSF